MADVSGVLTVPIIIFLMMKTVRTSEASVNFYETAGRNISDDRYLHSRRRENLESHIFGRTSDTSRQIFELCFSLQTNTESVSETSD